MQTLPQMNSLCGMTNKTVFKNGRTTGPTAGVLHNVEALIKVVYTIGGGGRHYTVRGRATVCIPPSDAARFAGKGDSGAFVMDHDARAVGMLHSINVIGEMENTFVTPAFAFLANVKRLLVKAGLEVETAEIV